VLLAGRSTLEPEPLPKLTGRNPLYAERDLVQTFKHQFFILMWVGWAGEERRCIMALMAASQSATFPVGSASTRGNREEVPLDHLLLQSLADSVDLMRHVVESSTICQDGRLCPEALHERIPAWERGQIVNSAAYIKEMGVEGKWAIPRGAKDISRQILAAEAAYREELEAASLAGIPWKETFSPEQKHCMRCGEKSSWRFVLKPPQNMPQEMAWRLARPENAVPICRRCADTVKIEKDEIRFDLAWGLWAGRFEALHRWYIAVQENRLPQSWNKTDYPLWPKEFGGPTWGEGNGCFSCCDPRSARGIKRRQIHFAALNRSMGIATKRREKIGKYFSTIKLRQVNLNPNLEPGEYFCECGCFYRGTGACDTCSRSRDDITG
jgi:hypothetical protein